MPMWSTQPWYSVAMQMLIDHPRILPQVHQLLYLKHRVDKVHPLQQKLDQTPGLSLIWRSPQGQGISKQAAIVLKSWRTGTLKQYQTYLNKWAVFCGERQVHPFSPSLTEVLDFLTLFEEGTQYSGLNTARSALSAIIMLPGNTPAGQHPLVCRFLRGVFQERPVLPRYNTT